MKIKYIADDGTEFTSERDCKEHEETLKEKKQLAIQLAMCELDRAIWQKYRNPSDVEEIPKQLASVWLHNDIVSILFDEEIDAEQRLQEIITIINESDYGSEILKLININELRKEVKIRRNWPETLKKVKVGSELSGKIGYSLSAADLKKLALLHQSNKYRKKIEDLLTDCNFHYAAAQFANQQYVVVN